MSKMKCTETLCETSRANVTTGEEGRGSTCLNLGEVLDVVVRGSSGLLIFFVVADVGGDTSVDGLVSLLTVEEGGGLLKRKVLGLNDEEVEEDSRESEPSAVDELE